MKSRAAHPGEMCSLVRSLTGLHVELPEDLTHSIDQLLRLPTFLPKGEPPRNLIGMTDTELAAALHELSIAFAVGTNGVHGSATGSALRSMGEALAAEVGNGLVDCADAILDQLRSRFDHAAAVMHHGAELGLDAGKTADENERGILRSDNIADRRDAWAAIPAASRTLEALGDVRIRLSTIAGLPPAQSRLTLNSGIRDTTDDHRLARSMFRTDDRAWHREGEDVWQRWLRLCTGTPVQLLAIDDAGTNGAPLVAP